MDVDRIYKALQHIKDNADSATIAIGGGDGRELLWAMARIVGISAEIVHIDQQRNQPEPDFNCPHCGEVTSIRHADAGALGCYNRRDTNLMLRLELVDSDGEVEWTGSAYRIAIDNDFNPEVMDALAEIRLGADRVVIGGGATPEMILRVAL